MRRLRSTAPMKIAKIGYIVISVLLCALGVLLIVIPDPSVQWIGRIFGVVMIVFGLVKLVGYFSRDLFRLAFQYDFATGILMLLLGAMLLLYPDWMLSFFCTVLGILILADGLFKVQIALDARHFGITRWWGILCTAIFAGVCGGVLIFRPMQSVHVMMILLGIALLVEGILNLTTVLTAVKIIRHQKADEPDAIEVKFEERKD